MTQSANKPASLSRSEAEQRLSALDGWQLSADGKAIRKHYKFSNFTEALAYTNRLGALAEEANHHPDLTLGWGYVGVTFTTHDAGGLRDNDFAMAKKADSLLK